MRSAKRFPFIVAFTLCTAAPGWATQTYCAVTQQTSDGFVAVRMGPDTSYEPIGKLLPTDFLYVGTEQCRNDFGPMLCSENGEWVFVEEVIAFGRTKKPIKGWAYNKLVRPIACPNF
jgi:hypothetical protein